MARLSRLQLEAIRVSDFQGANTNGLSTENVTGLRMRRNGKTSGSSPPFSTSLLDLLRPVGSQIDEFVSEVEEEENPRRREWQFSWLA